MPASKKRVKKNAQDEKVIMTTNPLKTWWGKAVIIVLALSFVIVILVSAIYSVITAFTA